MLTKYLYSQCFVCFQELEKNLQIIMTQHYKLAKISIITITTPNCIIKLTVLSLSSLNLLILSAVCIQQLKSWKKLLCWEKRKKYFQVHHVQKVHLLHVKLILETCNHQSLWPLAFMTLWFKWIMLGLIVQKITFLYFN